MSNILIFKDCITIVEAVAAITGLITWNKWKNSYFKCVPVYLVILVLCECVGYYYGSNKNYEAVKNLYMLFVIPMEFSFVCWLFYKNLPSRFRKIILVLWLLYLVFLVLDNIVFNNGNYIFMSLSYTVGNTIILILVLMYLIGLTISEDILTFNKDIMFWISAGLLIFYLGTFPYYGLYNIMAQKYMVSFINYTWVMIFLNYSMYLLFTIGFIWAKAK
ncbi:MAG: hypothetical protein ABI685_06325 [Ferruginibacter sp.]